MKTKTTTYNAVFNMANGDCAYDIRIAVQELNHKEIGRNNFLWHLREMGILDENNYATKEYRDLNLVDKISVMTKSGFHSKKVIISDAGLEYFEKEKFYDKMREQDKIYLEKTYGIKS